MTDTPLAPLPPSPANGRMVIVVVAAVAALGIGIAGTVIALGGGDKTASPPHTTSAPQAGCDPVITKPTDQNQSHINAPTPLHYADAPPSFGAHRPVPSAFGRPFYGADRPEVGELVHNMEHGYTIAWYDDTAAQDVGAMAELQKIATDYQSQQERFIAAPWHPSDGAAFPSGKHVALTRWTAEADNPADETKQRGNWMYCGSVDAKAIATFFNTWPNAESPEPGIL